MKKTILATMIASILGMTGCGDKSKPTSATEELQTLADQGQSYSTMILDITMTNATGGQLTQAASIKTMPLTDVKARIGSVIETLNNIANRTLLQDEKLERFQTYQDTFADIQTELKTYFEAVNNTQFVADANNAQLKAKFDEISADLEKGDDALTLGDTEELIASLHNLVHLEQAAVAEKAFTAVLTHALQGQYEEAVTAFDQGYALHENRQSLSTKTPAFVDQLENFLKDIDEKDANGVQLMKAANFTTDAQKLYQAFQVNFTDAQYIALFDAYFTGIKGEINKEGGLGDGNAVYNAINATDTKQAITGTTMAELSPNEVKALLSDSGYREVMKYILTQLRSYNTTQTAGLIAQTNMTDVAKLDEVLANLIAYIDAPKKAPSTIALTTFAVIANLMNLAGVNNDTSLSGAATLAHNSETAQDWELILTQLPEVIAKLFAEKKDTLAGNNSDNTFTKASTTLSNVAQKTVGHVRTALAFVNGVTVALNTAFSTEAKLKEMVENMADNNFSAAATSFASLKPAEGGDNYVSALNEGKPAYLADLKNLTQELANAVAAGNDGKTAAAVLADVTFIETAFEYYGLIKAYTDAVTAKNENDNEQTQDALTAASGALDAVFGDLDMYKKTETDFKTAIEADNKLNAFLSNKNAANMLIKAAVLKAFGASITKVNSYEVIAAETTAQNWATNAGILLWYADEQEKSE
jgi:hypothetical protein